MAIEKINVNNELFEPDENGVADLRTLLREHQDLSEYMPMSRIQFVTQQQWEQMQGHTDPNVFYFVSREL